MDANNDSVIPIYDQKNLSGHIQTAKTFRAHLNQQPTIEDLEFEH